MSATKVSIGTAQFGGGRMPVIAGPCSVEPDYVRHALAAADAGADVLRGCVFKPRSRPGRFQGIGLEGLPLLDRAHEVTGLPIIAEPLEPDDVRRLLPHVHAFLIGTRSMYNSRLLQAVGETGLPCVLKRGFSATYDEWLGAAEYVGTGEVILCERGIRTFVTETRNTLDLSALVALREFTDLPIIVDPSHAAGKREWVPALAHGAVAMGADGLIVESHPEPEDSWTDDRQAIDPASLRRLIERSRILRDLSADVPPFDQWREPLLSAGEFAR